MTAIIYEFRDYQSKSEKEPSRKALEEHLNQQAVEIANLAFPSVFGCDPSLGPNPFYHAPEKDPA